MFRRMITGEEFASFLLDVIRSNKMNKLVKAFILGLSAIIYFGLILLLIIVGVISLIHHKSHYEMKMGLCCIVLSLYLLISFTISFIKLNIYQEN